MTRFRKSSSSTAPALCVSCVKNPEKASIKHPFVSSVVAVLCLGLAGCFGDVTFPGDQIPESLKRINKEVYNYDVEAAINHKTIGVLYYAETLLDEAGVGMSQGIQEILGNLTMSVNRVSLSTDREIDYMMVTVRGKKEKFELQMIRGVVDAKLSASEALSTTEAMNRTVFQQARYTEQDEAKPFSVPDLTHADFLAMQILQRVRTEHQGQSVEEMPQVIFDGKFVSTVESDQIEISILAFDQKKSHEYLLDVVRHAADVISGYKFKEFDSLVVRDLLNADMLIVSRVDLEAFAGKKISGQEIIAKGLSKDTARSEAFKEALKAFGFVAQDGAAGEPTMIFPNEAAAAEAAQEPAESTQDAVQPTPTQDTHADDSSAGQSQPVS